MSDIFGPSFFFPGASTGGGVSKELRQRIALAMLAQKRKAPSTFGEGLSAIGDSLGDIGTMRRLAAEENAAFTGGNTKADELLGTTPPAAQGPSPVQAAAISAPSSLYQPPDQDPRSQEPVPPTVQEGGSAPTTQPAFRPNLRTATPPAQALPPAAPAVPAPPDVPGATRMSTPGQMADFRAQNPLPGQPGNTGATTFPPPFQTTPAQRDAIAGAPARPSVADYGQRPVLAPTPPAAPPGPVMAQGPDPASLPMAPPDDPRRAIGLALMKQRMGGQGAPPPAPAPPPVPPPPQGIAAAPPAVPIQKMPAPQQDTPPAGYVSPTPNRVIPPTPEPMSLTEAKLRDAIARDPDGMNGQLAKRLGPAIQTLEANRNAENQRKIDQYKIDLQHEKTMTEKIEEQKTTAAQRELTAAEAKRRLAKPDLEDIEGKMERDPATGVWGPPKLATPQDPNAMPQVKMSKEQADNLTFYGWAGNANKNMQGKDQLLAHGLQQELLGKVPVFGNQLQEAEYRRARNAANSFVLSFMRDTSGAAYGAKEMYDHASAFLPKLGDDAKTLADKAAARDRFVQGKYAGLGQGGQRVAQWQDAQDAAKDQTTAAKSIAEVGRPGARIGETVTSKKTGKQRVWDGKQWHDL